MIADPHPRLPGVTPRMIGRILPPWVAWAEAFDDPPDATLFPEEEALLARAVDRRRNEFTTARHCARKALALLGVAPAPILPGWRGAPQWPPAIVGSITHCAAYRAAAVARAASVASLGIDAEPHRPLPDGVLATIARPTEGAELRHLRLRHPETHWDRLLFCAKEAAYKAWSPLTERSLDFEEAEITIDPDHHTFTATLLVPGPYLERWALTGFTGRWLVTDGLVVTTITVPAAVPFSTPGTRGDGQSVGVVSEGRLET
jgi:4'-phosphopantetheinyl transferase EntD